MHGGHTHAPMGPPTGRPGHAGAATRGGGGGGRVRGAACVLDAPPPLRAAVGASVSSVFALSENSFVGVCQVICPYVLTLLTRKMH